MNAADLAGFRAAYLPLCGDPDLAPEVIENLGELDVVCIDDVAAVANDAAWERALLVLYEQLKQNRGRIIYAARQSPLHSDFSLADLSSRFTSGATFRVQPLSDEEKIEAMKLRARWRGLELGDDVASFVIRRVDRSNKALFEVLDLLDTRALTEQKKLTIPFVKAALAERKVAGASGS